MEELKWWGYRHVNGTIQVKRFFDMGDINEAKSSPFVEICHGPFPAKTREEAIAEVDRNTR